MRIMEIQVFTFDELSDEAKEHAIEQQRKFQSDVFDWSDVYRDAVTLAALMGISIDMKPRRSKDPAIYYSGFGSQGDGASFEGSYSYKEGAPAAIAKETGDSEPKLVRIAEALEAIQKTANYELTVTVKHSGHYYHSGSMFTELERCDANGDLIDIEPAQDIALTKALRDFADWIYKALEKEYEYRTSDESCIESIKANEYEFKANGELI